MMETKGIRVRDIMTKDPVTVAVPGSTQDALKLMVRHEISGLPVIKRNTRHLVGIVTRKDIFNNPHEEQLAIVKTKNPISVRADMPLELLAEVFIYTGFHRLPVIDDKENLLGICTPTDLLPFVEASKSDRPVGGYIAKMCTPVYHLTPLPVAAEIMHIADEYALPVLDDSNKLAGIVSDRDLFSLTHIDYTVAQTDLGLGDDEDEWTWEGLRNIMKLYHNVAKIELPKIPVRDIMIKDVVTVYNMASVKTAAHKMRKHDIGQLPLIDFDDSLIGMIYDRDIIKTLIP